jgi:hypothetical protein
MPSSFKSKPPSTFHADNSQVPTKFELFCMSSEEQLVKKTSVHAKITVTINLFILGHD